MNGTRDGAMQRIEAGFDNGEFIAMLAARVAIPTESQEPERLPDAWRESAFSKAQWIRSSTRGPASSRIRWANTRAAST